MWYIRVTLIRLHTGELFKVYRLISRISLVEIEFNFVSQHLPDDSDELAGTMPKSIVMRPALGHLSIVVSFEGPVVFNNIVSCIHECISKGFGSTL